jgi:hypothetical protein
MQFPTRVSPARLALLLLVALSSTGCAPVLTFTPEVRGVPPGDRGPHPSGDVEVYDREMPDWSYALAGTFQEASFDETPGGPYGFRAFMRTLGGVEGCDAVVLQPSVSRFDGRYEIPRRGRRRDRSWGRPLPIFERGGRTALCLVRRSAPPTTLDEASQAARDGDVPEPP